MVGPVPEKINELFKIIQPTDSMRVLVRGKIIYASDGKHGVAWTGKHGIAEGDYIKHTDGTMSIGSGPGWWDVPSFGKKLASVSALDRGNLEAMIEATEWSKRLGLAGNDMVSNNVILEITPKSFAVIGTDGRRVMKKVFKNKISIFKRRQEKGVEAPAGYLTAYVCTDKKDKTSGVPAFTAVMAYIFNKMVPTALDFIIFPAKVVTRITCPLGSIDYWAPARVTPDIFAKGVFQEERVMRTFRLREIKGLVDSAAKRGSDITICYDNKDGAVFVEDVGAAHERKGGVELISESKPCTMLDFNPLYAVMHITSSRPNNIIAFNAQYLKYITDMFKDNIIMHTDGNMAIFGPGAKRWF